MLRIYKLGVNPPSLYWDEASLGYNAYTILTSHRDEHGEFLPISRFIAFGDYKPPGYIYAAVPSIALFGLTEFGVRFPSMIAGLLMVLVTYLFVYELFQNQRLSLLSGFLLAISPWGLQFSRAAFESNLAAFFTVCAMYLFVLSRRKNWALVVSVIFFILSFYTFNANRVIAPLLLIGLSILYFKDIMVNKRYLIISIIIGMSMIYPSITYLTNRESRVRYQEVSIFNNLETIKLSNDRIKLDENSWIGHMLHNRRILFALDFVKHYTDNFSGRFLFTNGDVNPRLAVQEMGMLYLWDLPFLLIGLFILLKKKHNRTTLLLLFWFLIVPVPAATARETPHALRTLSMLPVYQILISYGLYQFIQSMKSNRNIKCPQVLPIIICVLFILNVFYYLHMYYVHYPRQWGGEWQYGYKQMVAYVSSIENKYDHIFVTEALGRPYIYFAFYNRYPLGKFLKEKEDSRDWFGFWNVSSLGKIQFSLDNIDSTSGRKLIVTTPGNLPDNYRQITTIKNLAGNDVFVIAD